MRPQPGDRVRLVENADPCVKGAEGGIHEILPNGDLVVVCDKDSDCNDLDPRVCVVDNWEPAQCQDPRQTREDA